MSPCSLSLLSSMSLNTSCTSPQQYRTGILHQERRHPHSAWAVPSDICSLCSPHQNPAFIDQHLAIAAKCRHGIECSLVCKNDRTTTTVPLLLYRNPSRTKTVRRLCLPCCYFREAPCFFIAGGTIDGSPETANKPHDGTLFSLAGDFFSLQFLCLQQDLKNVRTTTVSIKK